MMQNETKGQSKTCASCKCFSFDEFYTEDDYVFAPICYLGKNWDIEDFSEDTPICTDYKEEK